MISSNLDFRDICRICFEKINERILSSEQNLKTKQIWEKISMCFQITLDTDKFQPCEFCMKCLEDLNTAYNFRNKCVTIHERLQDYGETLVKTIITSNNSEPDNDKEVLEDNQFETNMEANTESEILKPQNYTCDICRKILKTKRTLMKHIVSMHEKRRHSGKVTGFGSARQYHCLTCPYSTPHSQTLVNHMRRHNGERPFKCECGKSFTQASSLAAHSKTHSATKYFTCTQCGKQFKHAFSLKTHMQVHKGGSFSCHICKKVLKSSRSLTSHLYRHYKIYNYNCEDCGDTFVTSAELHNHRMKHGSRKNNVCYICDYATYSKKNLLVHIKRHGGEKAHKCIFCEKAFLTEGNLKRHTRVHTREKPFACQTCTQRFAHSSSLNNHMLTFHGIKYKWGDNKLKDSRSKVMKTEKDIPISVHNSTDKIFLTKGTNIETTSAGRKEE